MRRWCGSDGRFWGGRLSGVDQEGSGGIFAFGLSEKTHGADIYSTDMVPTRHGDEWRADGRKYYIGNGNAAASVATFGRFADRDEYVFFAADPSHPSYNLIPTSSRVRTTFPSSSFATTR